MTTNRCSPGTAPDGSAAARAPKSVPRAGVQARNAAPGSSAASRVNSCSAVSDRSSECASPGPTSAPTPTTSAVSSPAPASSTPAHQATVLRTSDPEPPGAACVVGERTVEPHPLGGKPAQVDVAAAVAAGDVVVRLGADGLAARVLGDRHPVVAHLVEPVGDVPAPMEARHPRRAADRQVLRESRSRLTAAGTERSFCSVDLTKNVQNVRTSDNTPK